MGQSRVEDILEATIDAEPYTGEPQSRVEELLIELKETIEEGGGGGGTTVIPNPPGEATDDLEKVKIGSTIYDIPEGGTDVEANPTETATDELDSIRIGNDIFSIPSGGGGHDRKIEIYEIFDTLALSSRFAEGSLSGGFSFNMSEYDGTWSTSATAFNNTAIDLTDYDEIEIDVAINSQAEYGAFWVTLSGTKYTWDSYAWPAIYTNRNSAVKITESGTYTIDVSELSGNYYIYIGGTTGKDTTAAGDCNNDHNGGISGRVTNVYGVIKGSGGGVIPNPEGEPTDTLNTIEIDGVIYDLPSGGSASDIVKIYDSGSDTTPAAMDTDITYIDDIDISDYDLIIAAYSMDRGSPGWPQTLYSVGILDEILNDTVNKWVVAGYENRWAYLTINSTSFRVSGSGQVYGIYKLFAVKLGSSGSGGTSGAELLWEGDFSGSGTINVPNLSDWILVAYCNYTGSDALTYMSIGSPSRGGSSFGEYGSGNIQQFAYRFGYDKSTNTLTVNENDRGIYFGGNTTYGGHSSCHIYSIYGLVKKEGSSGSGSSKINYSTDEQIIGTWIDGSTLYQKTFTGKVPSNGGIRLLLDELGTLVNIYGTVGSIYGTVTGLGLKTPENGYDSSWYVDEHGIIVRFGAYHDTNTDYYITVQYTKPSA